MQVVVTAWSIYFKKKKENTFKIHTNVTVTFLLLLDKPESSSEQRTSFQWLINSETISVVYSLCPCIAFSTWYKYFPVVAIAEWNGRVVKDKDILKLWILGLKKINLHQEGLKVLKFRAEHWEKKGSWYLLRVKKEK